MRRLATVAALVGLLGSTALDAQAFRGAPRPHRSGISFALGPAASCGYDVATCNYFAAMTVQPDATRKGLLSTLVTCVEGAGLFTKLDALTIRAMHDSQAGLVNMISPSSNSTNSGMTFTVDRGYAGNGTNARILYTALVSSAAHYAAAGATMGVWYNANPSGATGLVGVASNTNSSIVWASGTSIAVRINGTTAVSPTTTGGHHYAGVRTDASTIRTFQNGSFLTSGTSADDSTSLTSQFAVGFGRGTYTSGQIAADYYGGILTDTDESNLHSCLNTYLSAIGAQ